MQLQNYTYPLKKQTKGEKKQVIALYLVLEAISEGRTRHLSAYYILKHIYGRRIYDYRARIPEMAARLGVCTKTLYTYLKYIKGKGLVYETGRALMFVSTYELKRDAREKRRHRITITKHDIQIVEALLLGKALENHARHMEFERAIERFEANNGRRGATDYPDGRENPPAYSLSFRNLMKLFNMGQQKTRCIVDMLNYRGVILTERNKPTPLGKGHQEALKYLQDRPGYFYIHRGILYQEFGNLHTFLQHPPNIQSITPKRYVKYKKSITCKNEYNYLPVLLKS